MFSCELPKDAPRTNPLTSIVSCGDLHLHPRPRRRSCGVNAEVNEDPKLQESVVLESARAEMGEVREENEKLKLMLERVEKDYNSLRRHFLDLLASQATPATTGHDDEELSLCLGMSSSSSSTKEDFHRETTRTATTTSSGSKEDEVRDGSCLTLGRGLITILDAEFPVDNLGSSDATTKNADREEVAKKDKEVHVEAWDPSKARAKRVLSTEEDACKSDVETTPQQSQAKRARVCVRARCQTPTMNDGCHWRKYGQKIAKGNPCPRAYYRCTLAQSCPVRKQVQRCADDMSILITTYEGTHNHPVPAAATAMVSTTSAAASMLLSGSSSSSTSTSPQYYSTPSPLFSTVTLDLTTSTLPSTTPPSRLLHFPSNTSLSFAGSSPPPSQPSGISNNGSHQQAAALTAETVTKALTSDPSFRTVIAAALTSMMNGSSSFGSPTTTMTTTATASHLGGGASSSLGIGFHSSSSSSSSYLPTSFPFNILNSASVSTATTNATSQE